MAVAQVPRFDAPSTAMLVPLVRLKEVAVIAYFGTGFLYYLKDVPIGHIVNLGFLLVFGILCLPVRRPAVLQRIEVAALLVVVFIAVTSLAGALVRGADVMADAGRSLSWLVPALAMLALAQEDQFRFPEVCGWIAGLNIVQNVLATLAFARFNPGLAKFEIQTTFLDISSNELSFHLMAFGLLFLLLAQYPRLRASSAALALLSVIHLSKAHLASMGIAILAWFSRGRLVAGLVVLGLVAVLLRLALATGFAEAIVVPDSVVAVFGRLRDMLLVAALLLDGESVGAASIAEAVGGSRFLVYSSAWDALAHTPFGATHAEIDRILLGLDPHSNLLYLALREGVLVVIGYLVACGLAWWGVQGRAPASNLVIAVLTYIFLRCALLTYDPVKIVTLFLFSLRCVVMAGPRPGPAPGIRHPVPS